tara:strand:+ start:341 stop:841 length:501 start_codon:yes stop_codon:yes gene_type:complete
MGFELKQISHEGVEHSLERATHYRLLNEPAVAESICHDILAIEPDNEQALITLILALTDQFGQASGIGLQQVLDWLPKLKIEYDQHYYTGIVYERAAKARLNREYPGAKFDAYELLHSAMDFFEKAEAIHEVGNDDSILRWNTCARLIMANNLRERPRDEAPVMLE